MIKYVVEQKFYDDGKVKARIKRVPEENAKRLVLSSSNCLFDLYNDIFDTLPEAEKFYKEVTSV